jgi:hypothetical protein
MSVVQVTVAELDVTFALVTFEITGGLFEGEVEALTLRSL